jgi:hypothetical protein
MSSSFFVVCLSRLSQPFLVAFYQAPISRFAFCAVIPKLKAICNSNLVKRVILSWAQLQASS